MLFSSVSKAYPYAEVGYS